MQERGIMKKPCLLLLFVTGVLKPFQHKTLLEEIISAYKCHITVKKLLSFFSNPDNDTFINQITAEEMNISTLSDQEKFKKKYKKFLSSTFNILEKKSCHKYEFLQDDYKYLEQILEQRRSTILEKQRH